ncbi:MAG TPA: hypothetical protein VGH68_22910, partial [Paraburkholderia sp.]
MFFLARQLAHHRAKFHGQLARKATHCEYLNQMQAHLSLALKAQAQSRATLEALAEIKNPRRLRSS